MRSIAVFSSLVAAALAAASPAAAQEEDSGLSVSLGVAATTNYIFRGITQSDDSPAIQPWAELGFSDFYAGVWGSNVDFGDFGFEVDFYGGYRNSLGPVDYDIGYARYTYTDSGDCCGEAYLKLSASPLEMLGVSGQVYYDPENNLGYVNAGLSVALPYDFSVSAGVGQFFDSGDDSDWNVGLGYAITDSVTADVRYYDSTAGEWLVNATISYSTDWSTLSSSGAFDARPSYRGPRARPEWLDNM